MATNVSAPLPDLTLEQKSLLVIDTGDAAAIITRVVIHFSQQVPDLPEKKPEPFVPLFSYARGTESPGVTR